MVSRETISAVLASACSSSRTNVLARGERVKHPVATGHSTIHVEEDFLVRAPKNSS